MPPPNSFVPCRPLLLPHAACYVRTQLRPANLRPPAWPGTKLACTSKAPRRLLYLQRLHLGKHCWATRLLTDWLLAA